LGRSVLDHDDLPHAHGVRQFGAELNIDIDTYNEEQDGPGSLL
jgi:hypothetical protein